MSRAVDYTAQNIVIFATIHNQRAKLQKILHICNTRMQKFTQNDQNHAKIYAEWHNSPLCCTKIYSICVFPVRSPSVQNVCSVGWFVLYGFNGYYGYFCSNTDFHGVSRNLCSSASVFFRVFRVVCFIRTRSLTDFHGVLFTCIRLIRVIRGLICSVRI